MWPFTAKESLTDKAQVWSQDKLVSFLMPLGVPFNADIAIRDQYLLLTFDGMQSFMDHWHDRSYLVYDGNSEDFPLCVDFAWCAYADAIRGAIKEGFPHLPTFGVIEAQLDDGMHELNIAVVVDIQRGPVAKIYEPQTDEWHDWGAYPGLKSIVGVDL